MARLLFLGASVSQLPAIRYAKAAGHEVVACDGDPAAVAFGLCDVHEAIDFSDVERVTAVGRRERVDGVLAICTDRAVVPAALVADALGLPGLDIEVAHAMTHKPTMRRVLSRAGVPQPAHTVIEGAGDLGAAARIPLPAVLKPADSGGQRGVFRIDRPGQLARHLPDTLATSRGGEALLEEFVEGAELNTLFAVRDGVPALLIVSDRLRPPGPGFGVGWIHRFPSELPESVLADVAAVAGDAIRALGLRDGIAFPQLIASDRGVFVVEVAARIAAGQMADLVRHGTGIEVFEIAITQALGRPVADAFVEPRFERPIAIRFLTASPGLLPVGTVTSIRGLDEVRAASDVLDAGLYFDVGARIDPVRVDADRRGYVVATGTTPSRALENADAAARKLRVEVERVERTRSGEARVLALLICASVLVAASGAFALTERAMLQRALIAGTHVGRTFSPVCACPQRLAHIAFGLTRRARVSVGVVEHRTPRLLSPIELDADRPRIEGAVLQPGRTTIVRYRFGEPARAALFVDGARVVLTRVSHTTGAIRVSSNLLGRGSRSRVSLVAIDPAGNRSLPMPLRS